MADITYISGREVIGRIDFDLKLDNTDWIASAPLWIADCIADMDILPAMTPVKVEVDIVDYQCLVPLNLKLLDRVVIDGVPLTPHKAINAKHKVDSIIINHRYKYAIIPGLANNTIMTFGVSSGTAIFYYYMPAIETVDEYNIVMPLVIDNIHVINTIKWFIMIKLLQNGYVHPVFNLTQQNPYTNVGILWEKARRKAKNSTGTMNQSERRVISELTREFIKNYDYFYNEGFGSDSYRSTSSSSINSGGGSGSGDTPEFSIDYVNTTTITFTHGLGLLTPHIVCTSTLGFTFEPEYTPIDNNSGTAVWNTIDTGTLTAN